MDKERARGPLAAFWVMLFTTISRLLGFVRVAVIGSIFGAGGEADVLNAVFTIPNNLRKLTAEGALSSAFIPVLSRALVDDPAGGRTARIVRSILGFQLVILAPLMVVGMIFSEPCIRLLLDFQSVERTMLASDLFRLVINYLLLISVSALMMGVLNVHNRFVVPAATPVFFSIFVIASILLFHREIGIFSMALGVLAGGLAQIMFQVPQYRAAGYGFRPTFDFRGDDFRRVLRLWLPVVATASVFSINEQLAVRFATGLAEGSASAMSNALVFWQLPQGIFAASITTVLFPRMSREAGRGDQSALGGTLAQGLSALFALLVPASLLLMLFSREIVAVALQRGNFSALNTELTAATLQAYAWGLFPVGAFSFCQRLFYAMHDYAVPLRTSIGVFVVDVALSLLLKDTALGVTGLAHANSISFSLGFLVLLWESGRGKARPNFRALAKSAARVGVSQAPLAAFVLLFLRLSGDWWRAGSTLHGLALLALGGAGSAAIVVGMYLVLKVDVIRLLVRRRGEET